MKFSKYCLKAVTFLSWPYFKSSTSCFSNKATTICGYPADNLRQLPVRHNRGGVSAEIKVQFSPPVICRLTLYRLPHKSFPPHSLLHSCKANSMPLHNTFPFLCSSFFLFYFISHFCCASDVNIYVNPYLAFPRISRLRLTPLCIYQNLFDIYSIE